MANIITNDEDLIEKKDSKKLETETKFEKEIEIEKETELEKKIKLEKIIIKTAKKKETKLAKKQQKIVELNFFNKTLDELRQDWGNPSLLRNDGNTQIARFDTLSCRLFLFFNSNQNLPKVEHFEIRDTKGNLIDKKEDIQNCYNNFKLT